MVARGYFVALPRVLLTFMDDQDDSILFLFKMIMGDKRSWEMPAEQPADKYLFLIEALSLSLSWGGAVAQG